MPSPPNTTPPRNLRKNLFEKHYIKEKLAENNLVFSFFYLEVLW